MLELTRKLVEAFGPSGFESEVRSLISDEIKPLADDLYVDPMGNLIARRKGTGSGIKVMVATHMDEIGLMVTHVTKHGFLRFTNIGGIRPHSLMGNRVRFQNGTIGVIYSEKLDSRTQVHPLTKHYIDVGATSREDCPVSIGEAAAFERSFTAQADRWIAKSMDDRIGCVVAIETMRQLKDPAHDITFVFSVQEEVGTRGAQAAANALLPDIGIAVDVTICGDTPQSPTMSVELGSGPAIKIKDSGMIAHTGLVRKMKSAATENGIPFQLEVLESGSTDARSMQIAGPGCAAGCISIPTRYVHTQSEMVSAQDVENSVRLLVELLQGSLDLKTT